VVVNGRLIHLYRPTREQLLIVAWVSQVFGLGVDVAQRIGAHFITSETRDLKAQPMNYRFNTRTNIPSPTLEERTALRLVAPQAERPAPLVVSIPESCLQRLKKHFGVYGSGDDPRLVLQHVTILISAHSVKFSAESPQYFLQEGGLSRSSITLCAEDGGASVFFPSGWTHGSVVKVEDCEFSGKGTMFMLSMLTSNSISVKYGVELRLHDNNCMAATGPNDKSFTLGMRMQLTQGGVGEKFLAVGLSAIAS